ncbi:MAG TPA: Hsp70 family protein, partial [Pirellulales bacterium]|nr:Hsp70 family protein [Pirellulales bacterium]
MASKRVIGIDLGSSRCALARIDESGRSVMIRNSLGDLLIPSVVYFEDDELIFGRSAKQAAGVQPGRAAEMVKRDRGQAAYSRAIGGQLMPAEFIEGCLLAGLAAELTSAGEPGPSVVLSHPVAFDQAQRMALLDAAAMAGLDVIGTVNDPLAIALSFAETQGYLGSDGGEKPRLRALVFDLGSSKLDVAIIEIKSTGLRTRGLGGDPHLGGRDWDLRLADYLAEEFAKKFGQDPRFDMASVRRLLETAEEAKQTLTARQQARIRVERSLNSADITITRQVFERLTADLLERSRQVTERVLSQASLAWRDLTHLLLVGGASRMPMIGQMLEKLSYMQGAPTIHPDEAVARGAALYGGQLLARQRGGRTALEIVDSSARSLGLEWHDPESQKTENVVLIPRGTEMPSATTSKLHTQVDDQQSLTVQLLEGESRTADECIRIAELTVDGLPPGLPRYTPIEVSYQLTPEGRLVVAAHLQPTGDPVRAELRRSRGLSPQQLSAWQQVIASRGGLKAIAVQLDSQPRESPPEATGPEPAVRPPQLPSRQKPAEPSHDEAEFPEMTVRLRRNRNSQRKLWINVVGYAVFSALGLL